jgi:hypothetical protein
VAQQGEAGASVHLGDRHPEQIVLGRLEVPEPVREHREGTLDRRVDHDLLADRHRFGLSHQSSWAGTSTAVAYAVSARCQ